MLFSHKLLPFALTLLSVVNAAPLGQVAKRELLTRVITADPTTVTDFYSTTTRVVVAPTVEYIVKNGVTFTTTLVPDNLDVTADPVTTTFTVDDDQTMEHSESKDDSSSLSTVTLSPAATTDDHNPEVVTVIATESSTVATLTSLVVDTVIATVYLDPRDDPVDNDNVQYSTSFATFITTLDDPETDVGVNTVVTKVNSPVETKESVIYSTYVTTIPVHTEQQGNQQGPADSQPGSNGDVIYSTYYSTFVTTIGVVEPQDTVASRTSVEVQVIDSVSYSTYFSTFVSTIYPDGVNNSGESPSIQTFVSESVSLSTSFSTRVTTLDPPVSHPTDGVSFFTSYSTRVSTYLGSTTKTFADGSVATSVGSNPYPVHPQEGDKDQVTMKLKSVPVALTYSPYTDDFGCKSIDQMLKDLTIIKNKGVYQIRVYGTRCGTINTILPLAAKLGIKVNQGLWIGPEGTDSIDEPTEELLAYGKAHGWDVFEYITIGNEAIFAGYFTAEELISKIHNVTSQLRAAGYKGQITTSEPPSSYISHPELCNSTVIDFVGLNAHSYFDPWSSPKTAGSFMLSQLQVTQKVCGTNKITITETGFPYKGDTNGGNVPSRANQVIALQNIFDVTDNQVTVLSWENDMWKDPGPYGIEQYFGVNPILP